MNESSNSGWWDLMVSGLLSRLGLNHPLTAVGGIQIAQGQGIPFLAFRSTIPGVANWAAHSHRSPITSFGQLKNSKVNQEKAQPFFILIF